MWYPGDLLISGSVFAPSRLSVDFLGLGDAIDDG